MGSVLRDSANFEPSPVFARSAQEVLGLPLICGSGSPPSEPWRSTQVPCVARPFRRRTGTAARSAGSPRAPPAGPPRDPRTSILPVTAAEIRAVRRFWSRTMAWLASAMRASSLAVSRPGGPDDGQLCSSDEMEAKFETRRVRPNMNAPALSRIATTPTWVATSLKSPGAEAIEHILLLHSASDEHIAAIAYVELARSPVGAHATLHRSVRLAREKNIVRLRLDAWQRPELASSLESK